MWSNFYADGGWGMYPTTVFGFLLVVSGVILLLRPERRYVPLVSCLGLITLGSGLLGTCVGIINTFHYLRSVAPADQLKIATIGCAESLNNLVLALLIIVFTCLLAAVGAVRALRNSPPVSAG
jgi:hypothetical protein